ncbi:folate-binding protein YgfZ [Promineifilum sp.]|uniref:CAF17-like 4Fe-4S cluster assembly/insertion protein YgfZ n=1 Tax=Promineifilum sp. TaxID=2664178 RepID=UPI0035AF3AFE
MISNEAYRAAHEAAVLADHAGRGMLRLSGKTRLELIHRMSTQAVNGLKGGEGAATVLTTDIGRIIDRILLYATSDAVYVLTGEGHADALARYFLRNVFFNDDFQLEDLSAQTVVFGIYGPRAGEMLAAAGFPEVMLPLHHWREAQIGGATAYLHRADPIAGDGYLVTANADDREAVWAALVAAGLTPIDDAAYDYLRIEAGRPRFGRELTLDYIPLEAGLWDDVSFHKGCYTGQEIIARMESRGKLAKRLVRLQPRPDRSATSGRAETYQVLPGTEIVAGDRPAGTITSAAEGPAGLLALGYVKTTVLDQGAELLAGDVRLSVM